MESLCGDTRQPDARSRAAGLSLDEDGFVRQAEVA